MTKDERPGTSKEGIKPIVIQPDDLHIEIEDLLERKFNVKQDEEVKDNE